MQEKQRREPVENKQTGCSTSADFVQQSADFTERTHQDSTMSKRKGPSEDSSNGAITDFLMGKL